MKGEVPLLTKFPHYNGTYLSDWAVVITYCTWEKLNSLSAFLHFSLLFSTAWNPTCKFASVQLLALSNILSSFPFLMPHGGIVWR
jgi:hypothetical protein